MSLAWSYCNDSNPSKLSARPWNHADPPSLAPIVSDFGPWAGVTSTHKHVRVRTQSLPLVTSPQKQKRNRMPTDHGAFGFGCGVRTPEDTPPSDYGYFSEDLPVVNLKKTKVLRNLRWQREHLLLTSKHLPDRVPLPDKGKPVARRGRKATDQISDLTAGLPEED